MSAVTVRLPTWTQLLRRILLLWRSRRTTFSVCSRCTNPFVINRANRDTANLEPAVQRMDGTTLCGLCAEETKAERELKTPRPMPPLPTDMRDLIMKYRPGVPIRVQTPGVQERWPTLLH